MNQEIAKHLMVEGATFVLLNVPIGTEFGIDMKSWTTGENFKGVKMIPPGIHYVFYSSVDKSTGDTSPRMGFYHDFKKGEFVVRKWDIDKETVSKELLPDRDVCGLKQNILLLDNFLGPYPYDIYDRWATMSAHISVELCEKLTPLCGEISSALELLSCSNEDRPRISREESKASVGRNSSCMSEKQIEKYQDDLLPDLKPKEGTNIRFSTFPTKPYPDDSSPSEITKHCLDSTYSLDKMIENYGRPMDIVGEIEFCYICFLVGHSLEAFENWKKLVSLLCSCERAVKKYRYIYDAFISLLEIQVSEIPEEFLADIVTNNNFLYMKLRQLFAAVQYSEVDGRLKTKIERFKELLTNTYGWDYSHLESDDEDEKPVIVET